MKIFLRAIFCNLFFGVLAYAQPPEIPLVVETTVVKPLEKFSIERRYIGVLRAEKFSLLTPKAKGVVSTIHIEPGQKVIKDQLLISLKSGLEKRSVELAEKSLSSLKADLRRSEELLKTRDVTKAEVERLKREVFLADAKRDSLLDNTEIRAPFDGVVGVPRVVLGESVEPQTTILSIMAQPYSVFFNIPASRLGEVKIGQTVTMKQATSKISAVEMSVDPVSRTGFAKALFSSCDGCIVGDSVMITVIIHEKNNAIVIHRNAVFYKDGKPHVVVIVKKDKQLRANIREVVVGEEKENLVEITSGLAASEEIVNANPKRLHEGSLVSVHQ